MSGETRSQRRGHFTVIVRVRGVPQQDSERVHCVHFVPLTPKRVPFGRYTITVKNTKSKKVSESLHLVGHHTKPVQGWVQSRT